MTLITLQDGKILFRDGKVGTEAGCCCEEEGCSSCCSGGDYPYPTFHHGRPSPCCRTLTITYKTRDFWFGGVDENGKITPAFGAWSTYTDTIPVGFVPDGDDWGMFAPTHGQVFWGCMKKATAGEAPTGCDQFVELSGLVGGTGGWADEELPADGKNYLVIALNHGGFYDATNLLYAPFAAVSLGADCCPVAGPVDFTTKRVADLSWPDNVAADVEVLSAEILDDCLGACCDDTGECSQTLYRDCTGLWRKFTACGYVTVPGTSHCDGRCCTPDGECVQGSKGDCDAAGGTWSVGMNCWDSPCPPPPPPPQGVCCTNSGWCFDGLTEAQCSDWPGGGTWLPNQQCVLNEETQEFECPNPLP